MKELTKRRNLPRSRVQTTEQIQFLNRRFDSNNTNIHLATFEVDFVRLNKDNSYTVFYHLLDFIRFVKPDGITLNYEFLQHAKHDNIYVSKNYYNTPNKNGKTTWKHLDTMLCQLNLNDPKQLIGIKVISRIISTGGESHIMKIFGQMFPNPLTLTSRKYDKEKEVLL